MDEANHFALSYLINMVLVLIGMTRGPGRKRTLDDMAGSDAHHHSARQMPPPSPASSSFAPSPNSMYSSSHTTTPSLSVAPSSASLSDHPAAAGGSDSGAESSSYGFAGSSANTPHYAQPWSTPRSSAASLGLDASSALPADLSMSPSLGHHPHPHHSASSNPFSSLSFNTPSASSVQLDSAYLPSFAYSLVGDGAIPAQSPVQFDLSDLPFSGMDFLQSLGGSLTDDHTTNTNEEALWAQLSASPFKLGPDLPFGAIETHSSTTTSSTS